MSILNYIGSKNTLLTFINKIISEYVNINFDNDNLHKIKFFDGFSGTGIISKYFNEKYNYITYSNDLEYYSYILAFSLIKVNYSKKLKQIISELNLLSKSNNENFNLIANNYSEQGNDKRMFWTISNANKADAIIEHIKNLLNKNLINNDEYIFLLASLISSFDKVANTASVYGAYLKKYKKSSLNELIIKPIHKRKNIINIELNTVFNLDINNNDILNNNFDIVYLDLPYNNRQYSTNYHPLNFICRYDNNIIPYGKTGLIDSNKSNYCIKKKATETFEDLINNLQSKYILVSYNNEGLIKQNDMINILNKKGKTILFTYKYKKFKSNQNNNSNFVFEYFYLCYCNIIGDFQTILIDNI